MTTRLTKPKATRPALDARLVAWARAFHVVLDEMTLLAPGPVVGITDGVTAHSTALPRSDCVQTAATVAASLVIGAEIE